MLAESALVSNCALLVLTSVKVIIAKRIILKGEEALDDMLYSLKVLEKQSQR